MGSGLQGYRELHRAVLANVEKEVIYDNRINGYLIHRAHKKKEKFSLLHFLPLSKLVLQSDKVPSPFFMPSSPTW